MKLWQCVLEFGRRGSEGGDEMDQETYLAIHEVTNVGKANDMLKRDSHCIPPVTRLFDFPEARYISRLINALKI